MSDVVLSHCVLPLVHTGEQGICTQAQNLAELFPYKSHELFFAQVNGPLIPASSEKTAKQRAIFGRTMRKLVVHKRDREDALAFAAGN